MPRNTLLHAHARPAPTATRDRSPAHINALDAARAGRSQPPITEYGAAYQQDGVHTDDAAGYLSIRIPTPKRFEYDDKRESMSSDEDDEFTHDWTLTMSPLHRSPESTALRNTLARTVSGSAGPARRMPSNRPQPNDDNFDGYSRPWHPHLVDRQWHSLETATNVIAPDAMNNLVRTGSSAFREAKERALRQLELLEVKHPRT